MYFSGPKQIPWDGKLQYDYQLWIDSDIVFDSNKFWQLCDLSLSEDGTEREITAGWYATEDGHTTSVAHWLEEDDFRKNGGVKQYVRWINGLCGYYLVHLSSSGATTQYSLRLTLSLRK
jgi:hypothetical protein